jgi:small basic protein (TIGR04137 family)
VTIDKSLKRKGRLARSRNVLKRGERIAQMKTEEKWTDGQSPLGIPKTRVLKPTAGKKKKKAKEEGDAPAGKAAKGAAGKAAAKAAAPAKAAAKAPAKK